jgi:hypothetical protein
MARQGEIELEITEGWNYKFLPSLTGGLNTLTRADDIDGSQLTDVRNLYFYQGSIRADTGYIDFADAVEDTPRATYQYFKRDGTAYQVLITNGSFYVYQGSVWQYVSDGVSTSTTAGATAGQLFVTVSDTTGFSDGDPVGIDLVGGTQHRTTVNGTPTATNLPLADAIPVGATVAVSASVVHAVQLSGVDTEQVSLLTDPASDTMLFTNGVDNVMQFDGDTCEVVTGIASVLSTCKALAILASSVLFINTTELGIAFPQRVRWSDTGDLTNLSTGNAGYTDLYDTEDFCLTAVELGPYVIIYRERTIVRAEYVGTADIMFNFDTMISGEGALCHDSVVDLGDAHLVMGNANIYEYRGDFELRPLGDNVYHVLFGISGKISPEYKDRFFALYIEELNEAWFFFTNNTDTGHPKSLARYRVDTDAWTLREWPTNLSGFGFYQRREALRWNEVIGTWDEQNWQWNSTKVLANAPTTLLCDESGKQVVEYDYLAATDGGTEISWYMETKQFMHPRFKFRLDYIELYCKGSAVDIEYRMDQGAWLPLKSLTLTSTTMKYTAHMQDVGHRVQFRLSGTGSGFSLEWLGFSYELESEW